MTTSPKQRLIFALSHRFKFARRHVTRQFCYSSVLIAPSPSTSGTKLTVVNSEVFTEPPFDVVVWPRGSNPTELNAEIMRVNEVHGDTFTVSRAQENTRNKAISVGYLIAATVTTLGRVWNT